MSYVTHIKHMKRQKLAHTVCRTPKIVFSLKNKYITQHDVQQKFIEHENSCNKSNHVLQKESTDIFFSDETMNIQRVSLYRSIITDSDEIPEHIKKNLEQQFRWMCCIFIQFKLQQETFFLACSYLTMFAHRVKNPFDFRGFAAAAIVVATKMEEVEHVISISKLLKKCSSLHNYNIQKIVVFERILLNRLEWRLSFIMSPTFYLLYTEHRLKLPSSVSQNVRYNLSIIQTKDYITYISVFDIILACFLAMSDVNSTLLISNPCSLHTTYNISNILTVVEFIASKNSINLDRENIISLLAR